MAKLGTGTSCKGQLANKNFQIGFVVGWGGFLSYWSDKLNKFQEEKSFGLNSKKREINTFENFSYEISICPKLSMFQKLLLLPYYLLM